MAVRALQAGADYIGLVFYVQSTRYVKPVIAQEIVRAVRCTGGEPVGVFFNASVDVIQGVCEEAGLTTVQLHGVRSIEASFYLPGYYQRIFMSPRILLK